jgi:mono/diheme cytochrome c family protein
MWNPPGGLPGLVLIPVLALGGAAGQAAAARAASKVGGDAGRGEKLFGEAGCNGCHTVKGIGGQVGPDLTRVGALDVKAQRPPGQWPDLERYLRESIENPNRYSVPGFENPSRMPSAAVLKLTDQEVSDLVAYLLSLK